MYRNWIKLLIVPRDSINESGPKGIDNVRSISYWIFWASFEVSTIVTRIVLIVVVSVTKGCSSTWYIDGNAWYRLLFFNSLPPGTTKLSSVDSNKSIFSDTKVNEVPRRNSKNSVTNQSHDYDIFLSSNNNCRYELSKLWRVRNAMLSEFWHKYAFLRRHDSILVVN